MSAEVKGSICRMPVCGRDAACASGCGDGADPYIDARRPARPTRVDHLQRPERKRCLRDRRLITRAGLHGAFFSENVVDSADLTADEIASGSWLSDDQLSPGRYWVVINGDPDLTCFLDDGTIDPACSDGYSNMLSVTIPQPSIRYRGAVSEMLADIGRLDLKLTVAPLGVKQAVRLCYSVTKHKHAAKRCVNQHLVGYDWNKPASALLALSTRGMSKRELFTWFVAGRTVARLTVRVPKNAR